MAPDGEAGYSAEVFNALGDTLAVITVPESALEALREAEQRVSSRDERQQATRRVTRTGVRGIK